MEKFIEDNTLLRGGTQKNYYEEGEKEFCNCPNCNADDFTKIETERGLGIVKCKACSLIYTNPRPINAEMNYDGEVESFYNEARLIFKGSKKHHRDANYNFELEKVRKHKKSGKFLDVGSNLGFFLKKAKDLGYETEGVEPSKSLSEISTREFGLTIHNSFLQDANLQKESYDIITLIDVFEHVSQPLQMLEQCYSILKKDGILMIKVPNGNYTLQKMNIARFFKLHNVDIWNSCEHLGHYTRKTFLDMATKNGFKVVETILPLPIHPPVWAHYVGQYYQYPSPVILDWRRVLIRNVSYYVGKTEQLLGLPVHFSPDLMFILKKNS